MGIPTGTRVAALIAPCRLRPDYYTRSTAAAQSNVNHPLVNHQLVATQ